MSVLKLETHTQKQSGIPAYTDILSFLQQNLFFVPVYLYKRKYRNKQTLLIRTLVHFTGWFYKHIIMMYKFINIGSNTLNEFYIDIDTQDYVRKFFKQSYKHARRADTTERNQNQQRWDSVVPNNQKLEKESKKRGCLVLIMINALVRF